MRFYAGQFSDIRTYYAAYERMFSEVYKKAFGKKFPQVEGACERFIVERCYVERRKIKGAESQAPVAFCTFLNEAQGVETSNGRQVFNSACMFIEDGRYGSIFTRYSSYLRQFNHFLIYALQQVPMDVLEMSLAFKISEKARGLEYNDLETAAKKIYSLGLPSEEKLEIMRLAAFYRLIESQRAELENVLDLLVVSQFGGSALSEALGLGIKPPVIKHVRLPEAGTEVLDIDGSLFYTMDAEETLARGIDWHENMPKIFDRYTTELLESYSGASYEKFIFADLRAALRGIGQA